MKLKPKKEKDSRRLIEEIQEAGDTLFSVQKASITPNFLEKRSLGKIAVCPLCKEAYPARNGRICKFCQGEAPYLSETIKDETSTDHPSVIQLPAKEAIGRRLFQYHTRTQTGRCDGLNDMLGEETADMSKVDADALGIEHGETVKVKSRRGAVTLKANVTNQVPPGMIWMAFHFREACANWLTNPVFDPVTLTAEYKACAVKVEKIS